MQAAPCPPLEMGLVTMAAVYYQYAEGEGKDATLKKDSFKKLVQEQLPHVAAEGPDASEVFSKLDVDGSGSVDFTEYCTMICAMAMGLHQVMGTIGCKQ